MKLGYGYESPEEDEESPLEEEKGE